MNQLKDKSALEGPPSALREVVLIEQGQEYQAVELVNTSDGLLASNSMTDYESALKSARQQGVARAYALGVNASFCADLQRMNFEIQCQLVLRRHDLLAATLPGDLKLRPFGLRSLASLGRKIRNRIIEMDLDEPFFELSAGLWNCRERTSSTVLRRTVEDLQQRVFRPAHSALVLRRQAGSSIDAFVVFDEYKDTKGNSILRLLDYWTSKNSRRSMIWLMGELSVWALAVGFDGIETFLVQGSEAEQAFIASGGLGKKAVFPVYGRSLDEQLTAIPTSFDLRATDLCLGNLGRS